MLLARATGMLRVDDETRRSTGATQPFLALSVHVGRINVLDAKLLLEHLQLLDCIVVRCPTGGGVEGRGAKNDFYPFVIHFRANLCPKLMVSGGLGDVVVTQNCTRAQIGRKECHQ